MWFAGEMCQAAPKGQRSPFGGFNKQEILESEEIQSADVQNQSFAGESAAEIFEYL
jgi:hypothetical protein